MKSILFVILVISSVSPALGAYQKIGGFKTEGSTEDVQVTGSMAVVANARDGVLFLDISDPISPAVQSFHQTEGPACRVALDDSRAYVVDWWEGDHHEEDDPDEKMIRMG